MKITVSDARALASVLTVGADEAEKSGQPDFDLGDSMSAQAQASLDELQKAIDAPSN